LPQNAPPVKVVLGGMFTVDSLVTETVEATHKLREQGVRAVDMEASLIVNTVQAARADMKLYLGYKITDVPGSINFEGGKADPELRALIRAKRTLANRVLSLTAHRILRAKDLAGTNVMSGEKSNAAMKTDDYLAWADYFKASTGLKAYLKNIFGKGPVVAMNPDMLAHYLNVRRIVNPEGRPLKVFYAGSGADVVSP